MKADLIDNQGMTARACVASAAFVALLAALAAVVVALAGCGGGDEPENSQAQPVDCRTRREACT